MRRNRKKGVFWDDATMLKSSPFFLMRMLLRYDVPLDLIPPLPSTHDVDGSTPEEFCNILISSKYAVTGVAFLVSFTADAPPLYAIMAHIARSTSFPPIRSDALNDCRSRRRLTWRRPTQQGLHS